MANEKKLNKNITDAALAESVMELSDDDLEMVNGGVSRMVNEKASEADGRFKPTAQNRFTKIN